MVLLHTYTVAFTQVLVYFYLLLPTTFCSEFSQNLLTLCHKCMPSPTFPTLLWQSCRVIYALTLSSLTCSPTDHFPTNIQSYDSCLSLCSTHVLLLGSPLYAHPIIISVASSVPIKCLVVYFMFFYISSKLFPLLVDHSRS